MESSRSQAKALQKPYVLWGVFFLPLALFIPAILTDTIPCFMDTVGQFYPIRYHIAGLLSQGVFPLWTDTYYCGSPLLANPQWGMLYPGNALFYLFPAAGVFTLTLTLHTYIGALGIYILCRSLQCGPASALGGALFFLFGGYIWAHYAFGAYFFAVAWIPWVLWCAELYVRNKSRATLLLAGLLIALQILSGAPQVAYYSLILYVLFSLLLIVENPKANTFRALIFSGGAITLGILLSAPQWLSTFHFLKESGRGSGLTLQEVARGALSVKQLYCSLMGGGGFPEDAETVAFFGAGVVLFAVLPLFSGLGKSYLKYYVCVFVFMLLTLRIFASVLFSVMPGYGLFHDPKRALCVIACIVPVCASIGIERFLKIHTERKRSFLTILIVGLLFVLGEFVLVRREVSAGLRLTGNVAGLHIPLPPISIEMINIIAVLSIIATMIRLSRSPAHSHVFVSRVIVILCFLLLVFSFSRIDLKFIATKNVFPESEVLKELSQDSRRTYKRFFTVDSQIHYTYNYTRNNFGAWLLPGVSPYYGLYDFQGYDPFKFWRYDLYLHMLNAPHRTPFSRHFGIVKNIESPLVQRAGVHFVTGAVKDTYPLYATLAIDEETEWPIYRLENPAPLVHFPQQVFSIPPIERESLRVPLLQDFPYSVVFVEDASIGSLSLSGNSSVTDVAVTSGRVHARVNAVEDSLLVVRLPCFKGWKATVDGKPARIVPTDILFMSVKIPKGEHLVHFTYTQPGLLPGLILFWCGSILILVLLRTRRNRGNRG